MMEYFRQSGTESGPELVKLVLTMMMDDVSTSSSQFNHHHDHAQQRARTTVSKIHMKEGCAPLRFPPPHRQRLRLEQSDPAGCFSAIRRRIPQAHPAACMLSRPRRPAPPPPSLFFFCLSLIRNGN